MMQDAAPRHWPGWYPEWYMPSNGLANHGVRVEPVAETRNFIATGYVRRRRSFAEQEWVQAMYDACPDCDLAATFDNGGPGLYDSMLLLFTGIQAAGPRLTPATVDRGLHSLPAQKSTDPFTPSAYFAPGNWSFVKDAMLAWWDPAGDPPDTPSPGCWRLVEGGLRYRAQDWTDLEPKIQSSGQPCQGEAQPPGPGAGV